MADGLLHLTALREAVEGTGVADDGGTALVSRRYSSARIHTRGKASFRYGRIEVRARLPRGQGLWPAIWMLPEHDNYGPFPQSGEIDIAEAVSLGTECDGCTDRIHAAVHHGATPNTIQTSTGSTPYIADDAFHVFAIEWTPDGLTWLVDDDAYFTHSGGPPFDQRFHLILNLAVGGPWAEGAGGGGIDDGSFPATLLIDWVRVYSSAPA